MATALLASEDGTMKKTIALSLAVLGLFSTAQAAEFNPIDDAPKAIALDGDIRSGDEYKLLDVVEYRAAHGYSTEYLRLNSPGGSVGAGLKIAYAVNRLGLKIVVGPHEECSSICMVIFAAGASRVVTSTSMLGVHSASTQMTADSQGTETMTSLALTAVMARQMANYSTPPGVIGKMMATPGSGIAWLDYNDVIASGWAIPYDDIMPRF
jgi:hypothetical protein